MKSKRTIRRMLVLALSIVMTLALLPVITPKEAANVQAATLKGPWKDSNGVVTYDCVWFGSYPQAEVITTAMSKNYTAIRSEYLRAGDLIVNDSLYQTLQKATGWDATGDITLPGGDKYRRIKKGDATVSKSEKSYYYNWSDDSTYHYFKYQPIKWKVLSVSGGEALLLADKGLDDREYNKTYSAVTWETCTPRSWLNGYGKENNSFINKAFNTQERAAIKTKTLQNKDNPEYGTAGGNATTDKVFLLSYDDIVNPTYGFSSDPDTYDKARRIQTSTYAKAMGTWWANSTEYLGNSYWWLRSAGYSSDSAMDVGCDGVCNNGYSYNHNNYAILPALYLNLSSSNLYSYAGTVNINGEVKLVQTITAKNITKTYGAKAFSLGAKTNGNGKLTYKSSNTKVARIDANGKVTIRGCGETKITITASKTENYNSASKTVTITVKPKKEKITSIESSKSKTLTVKWKKDTKATGYRIQYSTDKNFKKNVKTVWVKKNTITNKTITRLRAGKKYYVRVAAVHKTGKQKLIGTNSTVKSVRVKR